jgi:quinolinate synthase
MPITYMNLPQTSKHFVRNGGAVCTSSNAVPLFRWAMGSAKALLLDEHLGRNTGVKFNRRTKWWFGTCDSELGGNTPQELLDAKLDPLERVLFIHGRFLPHTWMTASSIRGSTFSCTPNADMRSSRNRLQRFD